MRCIRRCHLLLDLQEHRIFGVVAFEQHHVVPQADAPRSDDLEPDIDAAKQIEEMAPLRSQTSSIRAQRIENLFGLASPNPPEARPQITKARLPTGVRFG